MHVINVFYICFLNRFLNDQLVLTASLNKCGLRAVDVQRDRRACLSGDEKPITIKFKSHYRIIIDIYIYMCIRLNCAANTTTTTTTTSYTVPRYYDQSADNNTHILNDDYDTQAINTKL